MRQTAKQAGNTFVRVAAQTSRLGHACHDHTCPSTTWPWMHMGEVFCTVPSKPLTSITAAASNFPERVHLQQPRGPSFATAQLACCWCKQQDMAEHTNKVCRHWHGASGCCSLRTGASHSDHSLVCKDSARDSHRWVLHAMAALVTPSALTSCLHMLCRSRPACSGSRRCLQHRQDPCQQLHHLNEYARAKWTPWQTSPGHHSSPSALKASK